MDIGQLVIQQKVRWVLEVKDVTAQRKTLDHVILHETNGQRTCQSALFYDGSKTFIYIGKTPITIEGTIIDAKEEEEGIIRVELSKVMCSTPDGSMMNFRYRQPIEGAKEYRQDVRREDFMEATAAFETHLADRRQREATRSQSTRVGVSEKSPKYFPKADVYIRL
ncbi:hypothetical protein J4206_02205 [Candidatus Woesearchaeota archaeon]|nr:hypothetical protein [Candidatus Woesearchaeota archaeon]